jgi:hypothetical protein
MSSPNPPPSRNAFRAGDLAWLTRSGVLNVLPLSREIDAQMSYERSA